MEILDAVSFALIGLTVILGSMGLLGVAIGAFRHSKPLAKVGLKLLFAAGVALAGYFVEFLLTFKVSW